MGISLGTEVFPLAEEMMMCPECGKEFPAIEYMINDAGNPVCPECFQKESEREDKE